MFRLLSGIVAIAALALAPSVTRAAEKEAGSGAIRVLVLQWFADGPIPDISALSDALRTSIPTDVSKELGVPLETFFKGANEGRSWYNITLQSGENSLDIRIQVGIQPGAKADATQVVDAIVKRIRTMAVQSAQEQLDKQRAQVQAMQAQVMAGADSMTARIAQIRAKLREQTDRLDVSPEALHAAMAKLDDERQTLLLDKEDLSVRAKSVEAAVAEASEKAREAAKNDPISAELEKTITARETALKMLEQQYKSGLAQHVEVERAAAALGDAKVRLLERREALGGGSQALAAWNKELLTISIELKQKTARLAAVEAATKRLQSAIPLLERIEEFQDERASRRKLADDLRAQLADLMKQQVQRRLPILMTKESR